MKNPVNRLATAAPRALDSLLQGEQKRKRTPPKQERKERTCSFDLDLSGLKLDAPAASGGSAGGSTAAGVGGSVVESVVESVAEENSVAGSAVTFEELSEFWTGGAEEGGGAEGPSPN
ncbi:hypothetical protein ACHAWF_000621 [Thalassiosira exigua]